MFDWIWLVPALPLAGFLILALGGCAVSKRASAWIAVSTVGIAALFSLGLAVQWVATPPANYFHSIVVAHWLSVDSLRIPIGLRLDALSLVMTLVVTWVGFLIHLYSVEFMESDRDFRRFFAYMNLFVAAMLTLALADNLLLLYLGWEGVGLCSYLLIGFWYEDPANGRAAAKAFIVTRVGDAALAVGLALLFWQLGTLNIDELLARAPQHWAVGSGMATVAAALITLGAVGKSAQLPLQTWLPDAMAGPTPVSALIHAATMVTAGVYLIARTHTLFSLAPTIQLLVAGIGAATLLLGGLSALVQTDLKRVLAYSTMSQIGYMFLALGIGAWSAAIFHLVTHAFFKSLLFLGAGAIISTTHEHDISEMGGLARHLPITFLTFLAGSASLAGLPLVTAGFYSKDLILSQAWSVPMGGHWLWAAGLIGAWLTALYIFRVVFLVFFGERRGKSKARPVESIGFAMKLPMVVLAIGALLGGVVEIPEVLGGRPLFSHFISTVLPVRTQNGRGEWLLLSAAAAASLDGIYSAYLIYFRHGLALPKPLERFWRAGWGFDWIYNRCLVQPYRFLSRIDQDDFIDRAYRALGRAATLVNRALGRSENGNVRWYAMGIAAGAAVVAAIAILR